MTQIVEFPVEASSPPQSGTGARPGGDVVALPQVDLETVLEMVVCLREIGSYHQDHVRRDRLSAQARAEQAG